MVPARLLRSMLFLRDQGFRVRLSRSATSAVEPGPATVRHRVEDLHDAFADPEVDAVVSCVGGWASYQLLPFLDYELIARSPKCFIGYSDTTSLHVALMSRAGLSTFYGPAALPQFGEQGGPDPYTWSAFSTFALSAYAPHEIEFPDYWVTEYLAWDRDDTRPRRRERVGPPRAIHSGEASGPVLAANLETLMTLAGTPYWPQLAGWILLVELSDSIRPWQAYRALGQLSQTPGFAEVAGLGLGRIPPATDVPAAKLHDYLLMVAPEVPIAVDLPFGHTDPILTVPQGSRAALSCDEGGVRLSFLARPTDGGRR